LADVSDRADSGPGRFRFASPRTASGLAGLVAVEAAVCAILTILAHDPRTSFDGLLLAVVAVFGGVGLLVARREPSNPVGWLLLAASALFVLQAIAGIYVVLDYRQHAGTLPLAGLAFALQPSWTLGMVFLGLAVALFPDGRLASRRWRRPTSAYVGLGVWFYALFSLAQATIRLGRHVTIDSVGNYTGPQHGFSEIAAGAAWASTPLIVLFWIAFVVRQAATWRRADGERRQQLEWLMCGGAISIASVVVVVLTNGARGDRPITDIASLGIAAMPLGIGVGILKYRLYEIDRLISRTLSYLIITGLLAGVFVGAVALATDVLPFSSPVAVAASTLLAAALFNPLRRRVQHAVDRRFNRARYDAEAIVTAFTLRLRDAVDLDTVRGELLLAVDRAVEPAHASLWIRPSATPRA
jgi:hypothetical protein